LVLRALMQRANPRDFTLLPEDLSFEPFAIVVPQGDWAFRLAVNSGLAKIFRSGEVLQIYTRYFGELGFRPSVWLGGVFTFGGVLIAVSHGVPAPRCSVSTRGNHPPA